MKKSNFTGAPRTMQEAWFQSSPVEPGAAIERPEPRGSYPVAWWLAICAVGFVALYVIAVTA